jgi:hypothetical protein
VAVELADELSQELRTQEGQAAAAVVVSERAERLRSQGHLWIETVTNRRVEHGQ